MEGRDFAPPPHILTERGALVHRAASRITSTGHSSVQHPGHHFQPGKYYPSHLPMAPHSGSGLMGSSSTSFMGTFLASSLGSPPSHPSHPSGTPTSPPSPSFRGGPHSSASQIWFPHSHEAAPGYPRFSGGLAHTFLPVSHLDHHGNSNVLYDQHHFYHTQKENFYLRGLPSQQPIISTNHSLPSLPRTAGGHSLRSCSRERDSGGGNAHKSLKEVGQERGVVHGTKEKEKSTSKQEGKDRPHSKHHHPPTQHAHHSHPQPASLEEDRHKSAMNRQHKDDSMGQSKQLSACLLNGKAQEDNGAKTLSCCGRPGEVGGSGSSRLVPGARSSRCTKEGVSGEMRISEPLQDCLERARMPNHYPTGSGPSPPNFHCLPHHPLHAPHHAHPPHPSEFYCPPPHGPLHDKGLLAGSHDHKVTGPTFVPSVGHHGDKITGPFQVGNSECRSGRSSSGSGNGHSKDKGVEKGTGDGTGWPRKQQPLPPLPHQSHIYGKTDKPPDWLQNQQQHFQQLPPPQAHPPLHPGPRPRSGDCINGADMDHFQPSHPQGAKGGHSREGLAPPFVSSPPYRDCSHLGTHPAERKTVAAPEERVGDGCCSLQREGQKVARIRHQQHGRAGAEGSIGDLKRRMELPTSGYGGGGPGGQQPPQQQPEPPWTVRVHQIQLEEEQQQRKAYLESLGGRSQQQLPHQQPPPLHQQLPPMGPPPPPKEVSQGEGGAMRSLLKYNSQQQPLLHSQRSPFGGLGCLKSAACNLQASKLALASRKGPPVDGERSGECNGGRNREQGEAVHGEGEVRQPPVGIAVAVARQREPPCHLPNSHPAHQQGTAVLNMKGGPQSGFPLDTEVQEERKRIGEEHLRRSCTEREREMLIRDKKKVEFARIHPSSSCHGDLTSHLMMPSGTSLPSNQLGSDPAAHAHPPHHHWMPQTGSSSLWMAGHSYGISHPALHQNLPPGFSPAMPSPLQPVLPLPQEPPAQLVVLPSEPTPHPAAHLDVMEQPGLWPPVYGARGSAPHMQHATVYSRSQFLRQQELYALHQQQQHHHHRANQAMELQNRNSHLPQQQQKKPEDTHTDLDELISQSQTLRPAKPFSFVPSNKKTSPQSVPTPISPCCRSPSIRPHPRSTPCTPCPDPSSAAASPRSPALSPVPHRPMKGVESQDVRGEGQPPKDYPRSLEPDLPPGYTYPPIATGYTGGPSPADIQLDEAAEQQPVRTKPTEQIQSQLPSHDEKQEVSRVDLEKEVGQVETATPTEGMVQDSMPTDLEEEVLPCSSVPTQKDDPAVICLEEAKVMDRREALEVEGAERGNEEDKRKLEEDKQNLCSDPADDHLPNCNPPEPAKCQTTTPNESDEHLSCSAPSPCSSPSSLFPQPSTHSCWSLELLIAAALYDRSTTPPSYTGAHSSEVALPSSHGMELLSELADLELRQQMSSSCPEEELVTFDLQSLATLAAARALELGSESICTPGSGHLGQAPRTFNLRRKCTWTPRNEPVCPVKGGMDAMDSQELAMRVRLAELQQHYKEKQRELAKLQRKHDYQKEEPPRSPARRGPGRPRKRKSTYNLGMMTSADPPKKIRSVGAGLIIHTEEMLIGSKIPRKKKKKLSSQDFEQLSTAQIKARCCKSGARPVVLGSKLACRVSQLKQKVQHSTSAASLFRRQETLRSSRDQGPPRGSVESGDQSNSEEDEEFSYDSDEVEDIGSLAPKDMPTSSVITGPSPSSVVKLEANQKAKNKQERQGLYEGQVKVKKKSPIAGKDQEREGLKQTRGSKPAHLCLLWEQLGERRQPVAVSDRLKQCIRKDIAQPGASRETCKAKGRAVSRLLESFTANEGFQMDESSSFSEGEDDGGPEKCSLKSKHGPPEIPNSVLSKGLLIDGLKVLVSKDDELLYAARLHTLELPDIYGIVIDGERGSRPRIYSLEQLLQEAVLDVQPETEAVLPVGTRVCAYWSERSRCLYPGYVRKRSAGEERKQGSVMVEFDDGDQGWIALHNVRILPPDYQIHSPSGAEPPELLTPSGRRGRHITILEKNMLRDTSSERPNKTETQRTQESKGKGKPGRPKGSGMKNITTKTESSTNSIFSWPTLNTAKKNPFQVNGTSKKSLKKKEASGFPNSTSSTATTTKGIFSSSFPVDSFSSIANGCLSFGNQSGLMSKNSLCTRGRKSGDGGSLSGRKSEFMVKLDHEGVTSPKTKNGKALLLLGSNGQGGQLSKEFGSKVMGGISQSVGYSHPVLLVKDNKKGELLLKGGSHIRKHSVLLPMGKYSDFGLNCQSDSHSSYSDMDDDEDNQREAELVAASRSLRESFLPRLSVSSSSSGSSSSSSSGSLSSSSICSSDNDSSYSSDDEEGSRLLLQGCLSSHRSILQPMESVSRPSTQRTFVAKAVTVGGNSSTNNKAIKRKECPEKAVKISKDLTKKQKLQSRNQQDKSSSFMPAQQLWRWSGNPTQRRGLKGKARKLFYKAIVRGKELVHVGDCAVFLSAGRPQLPFVGRIESLWESWTGSMVVKVKWFYHPEETKLGKRHHDGKNALYQSSHEDENDVQTISHKCQVVSREEYEKLSCGRKSSSHNQDLYYLAGTYDPSSGQLVTAEGDTVGIY